MVNGDGKYYVIQLVVSGESCRNHSTAEPVAFHSLSPALIGLSSHFYRAVVTVMLMQVWEESEPGQLYRTNHPGFELSSPGFLAHLERFSKMFHRMRQRSEFQGIKWLLRSC